MTDSLPAAVSRHGCLSLVSAYELTKLDNQAAQQGLADKAAAGALTHSQATQIVRQRRGRDKPATKARGMRQVFSAENGLKVTVTAKCKASYHDIEEALQQALEEVRLRIDNNVF